MAYIRNQERMVYQTILDYLTTQLTTLGWMAASPGPWPFGATTAVTIKEEVPNIEGAIPDNTVAYTMGTTPDDKPGEMGAGAGGLWLTEFTFFIDVFGENIGVAKAIASDVRAVLTGKLTGTNRNLTMTDYSQTPAAPSSANIEFTDVTMDRPVNLTQRNWMTIKVTAELQYTGIENS